MPCGGAAALAGLGMASTPMISNALDPAESPTIDAQRRGEVQTEVGRRHDRWSSSRRPSNGGTSLTTVPGCRCPRASYCIGETWEVRYGPHLARARSHMLVGAGSHRNPPVLPPVSRGVHVLAVEPTTLLG